MVFRAVWGNFVWLKDFKQGLAVVSRFHWHGRGFVVNILIAFRCFILGLVDVSAESNIRNHSSVSILCKREKGSQRKNGPLLNQAERHTAASFVACVWDSRIRSRLMDERNELHTQENKKAGGGNKTSALEQRMLMLIVFLDSSQKKVITQAEAQCFFVFVFFFFKSGILASSSSINVFESTWSRGVEWITSIFSFYLSFLPLLAVSCLLCQPERRVFNIIFPSC